MNWWVAPTYKQSEMAYNLVLNLLPQGLYKEYKADLVIELLQPNGKRRSSIEFKSADNPNNLRGFGVKFFIMDEAARCSYDSFVSLFTTITQTLGRGFFISTPHARNWFYDVYQRGEKFFEDGRPRYEKGEKDPWPEWLSIRMPTWTNPTVPLQSITDMRKNLPDDVFRQEVAAMFMADSAGVFRGVREIIKGELQEPVAGRRYTMGVDLARLKDYSVLTVMDNNCHVVYFERFNKISWEVQYSRIIEASRRYNRARVVMDSTGIGDPIYNTIQNGGVNVEPYKISGPTAKKALIDKLRLAIEHQRISFPAELSVLRRELESYEYEISESGIVKFSAPAGMHDDCVISLALATWGADSDPWVYRYSNQRGV